MIYSDDINRVCALCRYAQKQENYEESVFCLQKNVMVDASKGDCKKFKYDIFKKVVHRKRRLKSSFDPSDFSLE